MKILLPAIYSKRCTGGMTSDWEILNLCYLRTKDQKEVDFLVVQDGKPWFLVEVKTSSKQAISKHLDWFLKRTKAKHAFQVCMDLNYVHADCFEHTQPIKISAENLLMRLI